MKNYPLIYILTLSLIVFNICASSAQQTNNTELTYITFDELVGLENISLYQGKLYIEKYRTINKNKQFFKSAEFLSGDVSYKGQPYFNQLLKYDVYEDELLLKLKGNGNTLKLSKKDIDSFSIGENYFTNLKPKKITTTSNFGYYEILFQGQIFALYSKHKKNIMQRKDKNYVYFEFKDAKKKYLLLYKGVYYDLNKKNDILRMFPNRKKEINTFYKRAKMRNKASSDALILTVIKQLESIL